MTSLSNSKISASTLRASRTRALSGQLNQSARSDYWPLQDAKARFSELVRKARSEGPQHVTLHGREEVVVIAAEEFNRLSGDLTGAALIAAAQASPYRTAGDVDLAPARAKMPVRRVKL